MSARVMLGPIRIAFDDAFLRARKTFFLKVKDCISQCLADGL
jgi:hypothetical protein